jgi:hypothetical protein
LDQLKNVPQIARGTTFSFNKEEVEACIRVSKQRTGKNRAGNVKDANFSGRNGEDIDLQGVLGEYAFCKLFGLPIEIFDTTCRSASNDTFDARLPNGFTVDIKTTIKLDASILVSVWKNKNPPDCYALMIYTNGSKELDRNAMLTTNLPVLEFKGFVMSKHILQPQTLITMGRGDCFTHYSWPQEKLVTFEELTKLA